MVPLRAKLIGYLAALHAVLAAAAWWVLRPQPLLLFSAEALFLISIGLGWRLVRAFFVPLDLIRTGAELIGEGDFNSSFRPSGQPEMDALVRIYNQMVTRLREERLRVAEQHQFLDRVLAASPAGVVTLDFDGRVSLANASAERLLGADLPGAIGTLLDAVPAGESRVVALGGGRRLKVTRGELYDRGFPRGFLLLEELTAELRASEKAAYGKLVRMMSHEINNSIGAVGSLLDSFRGYAAELQPGDREDLLQAIHVAVQRLQNLGSFTSGFAEVVRLPPPQRAPVDLRRLLDELVLLMRPELERRRIACAWEEAQVVGAIAMDQNQIEQVLVNVLRNAVEAIGEDGRIGLRLSGGDHRDGAGGAGGAAVTLSIVDSGAGIGAEVAPLLFTPFFSTKKNGRGLGLMLAQEILSQHGFTWSLAAAAGGRGAEFRVAFGAASGTDR